MRTYIKKISIKRLSVFIMFLSLMGCSLKETLYDTPTAEAILVKETDVPAVLYGIYGQIGGTMGTNNYLVLTNGCEMGTNPGQDLERSYTYDGSSSYIAAMYNGFFKAINNANSLLESMESIKFTKESDKNRYIGETSFLRSFSYFNLVRLFGKVPMPMKSTKASASYSMSRSPVDTVYARIFRDFKVAALYCPKKSVMAGVERGRVTKGAAHALLAEAYLTYANYLDLNQKAGVASGFYRLAAAYADSVILATADYSLIPKYNDLYDITKETDAYKEVIFGIQFTADNTAGATGSNGTQISPWFSPGNMFKACGSLPDGLANALYGIVAWAYDKYTSDDYKGSDGTVDFRMSNTMVPTRYKNDVATRNSGIYTEYTLYPQIRNSPTDVNPFSAPRICCTKYLDPRGIDLGNNGNDIFYIRLAEVYMLKAEALNEINGPTQEAVDAVNKVRARARASYTPASLTPKNLTLSDAGTKEDFRMKIYDERVIETYAEGRNFFDVRRMRYKDNGRTMLQYYIEEFWPTLKVGGKYTTLNFNITTNQWEGSRINPTQVPATWNVKYLLFPIPYTEYQLNPGMQGDYNPGWN
jgi:hypothetical protein